MQFFSSYELNLEFEDNNDEYLLIKSILEKIGYIAKNIYNKYRTDICHYVILDSTNLLSCCVHSGIVELGIINKNTKQIQIGRASCRERV